MAIGYETLQKLANYLPNELLVGLVPQEHRFRSVHGRSSTTHVASLPTSIGPKCNFQAEMMLVALQNGSNPS